ncbi:hypothetical protein ACJX0J_008956, partial [Zea mays]
IRKGEGMELDQLFQNSCSSEKTAYIQPFDMETLGQAFQLRETAPVDLPSAEKGTPTISGKSKVKSKDKVKKHKKHKEKDRDKEKEQKKHKHRHKDRSKDKDKDKDKDKEKKKDKSGNHDLEEKARSNWKFSKCPKSQENTKAQNSCMFLFYGSEVFLFHIFSGKGMCFLISCTLFWLYMTLFASFYMVCYSNKNKMIIHYGYFLKENPENRMDVQNLNFVGFFAAGFHAHRIEDLNGVEWTICDRVLFLGNLNLSYGVVNYFTAEQRATPHKLKLVFSFKVARLDLCLVESILPPILAELLSYPTATTTVVVYIIVVVVVVVAAAAVAAAVAVVAVIVVAVVVAVVAVVAVAAVAAIVAVAAAVVAVVAVVVEAVVAVVAVATIAAGAVAVAAVVAAAVAAAPAVVVAVAVVATAAAVAVAAVTPAFSSSCLGVVNHNKAHEYIMLVDKLFCYHRLEMNEQNF